MKRMLKGPEKNSQRLVVLDPMRDDVIYTINQRLTFDVQPLQVNGVLDPEVPLQVNGIPSLEVRCQADNTPGPGV